MMGFLNLFRPRPSAGLPTRRPHAQRVSASPAGPMPANGAGSPVVTNGVFTPTQPKTGSRQITGRQAELTRILQSLTEDRAHVVLYSERGRGKTSLANMVVEMLRQRSIIVTRYTCDASSDFDSILHGLACDLPSSLLANPPVHDQVGCEAIFPARALTPGDVPAMLSRLTCQSLVCVVDEFDRLKNATTRTLLADAIKQLSDRDVRLQFLIVGVSDNLDEILGQHPSIQRSVMGVHLPLFTDRDMAQLISKASQDSGYSFPPDVVARITVLSRGMPYMAQLLGLRLTQAAAARNATQITHEDVAAATMRLIADANPRTTAVYAKLTDRGRDSDMLSSLRRIASARQDAWGSMEVVHFGDGRGSVGGRRVPGACLDRLMAANVLTAASEDDHVVFANRALMHHVLLLAVNEGGSSAEPGHSGSVALRSIASQA